MTLQIAPHKWILWLQVARAFLLLLSLESLFLFCFGVILLLAFEKREKMFLFPAFFNGCSLSRLQGVLRAVLSDNLYLPLDKSIITMIVSCCAKLRTQKFSVLKDIFHYSNIIRAS